MRALHDMTSDEIEELRRRIDGHPALDLYLATALDAVAAGQTNRMAHLATAGGVVLSIAFESIEVHSTLGILDEGDIQALTKRPGRCELQLLPEHADAIRCFLGTHLCRERRVLFYGLDLPAAPDMPDSVVRLGPGDTNAVRAFMQAHNADTVFSEWMLDHPFYAALEDGGIAATAGTVLTHRASRRANLGNLLTRPDLRRRGYGRLALQGLISDLSADGITGLSLVTTVDNSAARALAESFGFRILEERIQIDMCP